MEQREVLTVHALSVLSWMDTTGSTAYAEYNMFAVSSERTKYTLSLGSYSGRRRMFATICY